MNFTALRSPFHTPVKSLTLTVRALRLMARDPLQFGVRVGLVALVLVALAVAVATSGAFGAPGLNFFRGLVWIDVMAVTLLGLFAFASVITEEKQAETLGLLALAGFRPISILFGKSLGLLVMTAQLLAVQLPFAVLAVTLGGVSPSQVWGAYVLLLGHAVFVYGVALLASTLCATDGAAARATGVVLACVLVLPWLGKLVIRALVTPANLARAGSFVDSLGSLLDALGGLSALQALENVFRIGFAGPLFSRTFFLDLAVGAVLVLASWLLFPQQAREVLAKKTKRGRGMPTRWSYGARARARSSALAWKDFHFVAGGARGRRLRFWLYGLACLVLLVLVQQPGLRIAQQVAAWGSAVVCLQAAAILVEAGIAAGRVFRVELQQNTLTGLALLPARLWTSASEKVRGSMAVVQAPLVYLGVGLVAMILASGGANPGYWLMMLAAAAMVALYAFAVVMFVVQLTLYLSLWLRRGAFALAAGSLGILYAILSMAITAGGAACLGAFLVPGALLLGSATLAVRTAARLRHLAAG